MKKIISLFFLLCVSCLSVPAQSRYVSYSPMGQEDRRADLDGNGGVLLLSKRSDLVISVVNAAGAKITPRGRNGNGMYEYEVIVNKEDTPNPQLEVSQRGDVVRTKFVVKTRPDILRAYLIDEVERPITMEDQTAGNDAILDATLAEVEIVSAISDLKVDCKPSLGASITQTRRKSDETVTVTSVKIPIASITNARQKAATLRESYEALQKQLFSQTGKKNDADFDRLDKLEEEMQLAEQELEEMCSIDIYAKETNRLSISVRDMKPRSKMCYGILALKTVVREHVSKCSGMLEEGGRLFAARKYDEAKRAFANALSAGDTPDDMVPAINSNIAQCDSCILYENLTKGALIRIKQLKDAGSVTQAEVAQYYTAAIEFMKIVGKYNPCDYYTNIVNSLETFVENMPLAMRFTIVKWVTDRVSASEGGPYPGIELWAFYGAGIPKPDDYSSGRKFRKLVSQSPVRYKRLDVSNPDGVIDLALPRKSLPAGFFFHSIHDDGRTDIVYKDMQDIMRQSKEEYNKRQFRLRMYVRK